MVTLSSTGAVEDLLLDSWAVFDGVSIEKPNTSPAVEQPVVVAHPVRRPHREHALTERQAGSGSPAPDRPDNGCRSPSTPGTPRTGC